MRPVVENLVGYRFGRLVVIKQLEDHISPSGQRNRQWLCRCDCGELTVKYGYNMKSGMSASCGCLHKERILAHNKKTNDYEIQEDYVIMYTSKGDCFLVDLEDFPRVREYCWCKSGDYFVGTVGSKGVLLHRFIMNPPEDKVVDHIGGTNTIYDNRRCNLRIVTLAENNKNQNRLSTSPTGVVGVLQYNDRYMAHISVDGKDKHLGYFDSFEAAVAERQRAEELYQGNIHMQNRKNFTETNDLIRYNV